MKKTIEGVVISTKMNKTAVVKVVRKLRHPLYKKVITRHKNFKAHLEQDDIHEGDFVSIEQCIPISKDKRFRVVAKVNNI